MFWSFLYESRRYYLIIIMVILTANNTMKLFQLVSRKNEMNCYLLSLIVKLSQSVHPRWRCLITGQEQNYYTNCTPEQKYLI